MPYNAVPATKEIIEATKAVWIGICGQDEFASEYGSQLEWAIQNMGNTYALIEHGHKSASAIMEVVQSERNGGLTKLLRVLITPQFWDIAEHQSQVVKLYLHAIKEAISISTTNKSKTYKIYGRTPEMLSLLYAIHSETSDDLKNLLDVNMQGRWLVFSAK